MMATQHRGATAARFRADMQRLLHCVARLSPAQTQMPVYGTWTVTEILAHVAAWDREIIHGLDELLVGARPSLTRRSEDEFNAGVVERARGVAFADVLSETQAANDALVRRIERLTDGEWGRASGHRWGRGSPMTVASLFAYSYKGQTHYAGHASEIEEHFSQ
jgi:uncharacterized damage-inducible protein DinB